MNRNIILGIQDPSKIKDLPESTEYIHINNLSQIVNHSVDYLFSDNLEYLNEDSISTILKEIMNKIRPKGYLSIKILDIKKICLNFINNQLPSTKYIEFLKDKNSILNLDTISVSVDYDKFITTKIVSSDYYINIILQRISL